jgi:histidinol phosphatase-like PHP family hydrolase
MDLIVDKICDVLREPMDIYVNPCFLPPQMQDRYDEFWTEARMNRFVEALAKSGKALEINNRYKIPNKAIIQKAKAAGVKFTFGTNNAGAEDVGLMEFAIRMKKECGITAADMYKPKIKI